MIKAISEIDEDIIKYILETDSEVMFRFHSKYMEQIESILRPKTSGASISPYSNRNLPRNKTYKLPDGELDEYRSLVKDIPPKDMILIGHITNDFLKSLTTKKFTWDDLRADMQLKGLKGKEYIHSIGKWNDYIKYLTENLKE